MISKPNLVEEGSFEQIPREQRQTGAAPPPHSFRLLTIAEVLARSLIEWLVKHVIRRGEVVVFYGESGTFKTFIVIDLILKIAANLFWWNYKTSPGVVWYFAGEGVGGLRNRVLAWAKDHGVDAATLGIKVLPQAFSLLDDGEFRALLNTVDQEAQKPSVIVLDTLNRYMGGDENSAEEMRMFVERCSKLAAATGAAVIVIHHKSKNAQTERGSTALRGGVEVMIDVTLDGETIVLEGSKSKDGKKLPPIYLKHRVVELDLDEDGEFETSVVLDLADAPPPKPPDASGAPRAVNKPTKRTEAATRIRSALAGQFGNGPASAQALSDAAGPANTVYYDALNEEKAAGRIELVGGRGAGSGYVLTPSAPEYVRPSPSPSPGQSADWDPDSSAVASERASESKSASAPAPLGAARTRTNSRPPDSGQRKGAEPAEADGGEVGNE